jgi:arylsulfatase A-like enzyme
MFTSDHGEMLGDHWCWGKETPFDGAVRVPMIVKSPMAAPGARGRVVEAFTEHVDVTPTILDHVGVEVPLQCDGRSLRPFLEGGQPAKWRDAAHWEFDFRSIRDESVDGRFGISIDECGLAVARTATHKYVHFAGLPPLFYDIAKDPAELNNLSGQPAHAAAELAMARRMLSWRMAFNRRELTGIRLMNGTQVHAARSRRIV